MTNGHVLTGGVFEPEYESQQLVLEYAITKINQRRDILRQTILTESLDTVPNQDSFAASKKGCVFKLFFFFAKQCNAM